MALTCLCAIAFVTSLRAQAAVEYAAKSAGAALENTAAGIRFGVCGLDSTLVRCVNYHYPATFYVVLVAICFLCQAVIPKEKSVTGVALSRSQYALPHGENKGRAIPVRIVRGGKTFKLLFLAVGL